MPRLLCPLLLSLPTVAVYTWRQAPERSQVRLAPLGAIQRLRVGRGGLQLFPRNGIFHIMRKGLILGNNLRDREEPNPQRLLVALEDTLKKKLPPNWSVALRLEPRGPSINRRSYAAPDAELTIRGPDGSHATLMVEAKRRVDPKLVPLIADLLARYRSRPGEANGMVVAPFFSPRARQLLAQAGVAYADATGNLRLVLGQPALYVEAAGASSDPWAKPGDRPLRSLKGPTAGRVVRALCEFRPPFQVQQLARRSDTSLGSVARVFAFLDAEGLITRDPRGPVTDVKWADLLRRWAQDYAFARSNTTRTFLEARGLPALLAKLRGITFPYAITSSLAAALVAPVAASRLAALYVDDIAHAAETLGLRRAETGGNAILAEPFDPVVFERTWERAGLIHAAHAQIAVDLLTGPGRGPAEGEELIRWMQEHEDAWRS